MNSQTEKKAICILGSHRSGTSAITRGLNLLGAYLGEEEDLLPPKPDNPEGFWERDDIVVLHDRILNVMKRAWDTTMPMPERWHLSREMEPFRSALLELIMRTFSSHELWAWKDPRTSMLLPLWIDVLDSIGIKLLCVFVVRNPLDVARSLSRRVHDGKEPFSIEKSFGVWFNYNISALNSIAKVPTVFISYDRFVADWKTEMRRCSSELGVRWPEDEEHFNDIMSAFVRPDLRHSCSEMEDLLKIEAPAPVIELYEIFHKLINNGAKLGDVAGSVNKLYGRFSAYSRFFGQNSVELWENVNQRNMRKSADISHQISMKDSLLADYECRLKDQGQLLREKESLILVSDNELRLKDTVIKQKDEDILRKETIIRRKEEELRQKEALIAQKNEALLRREATIRQKDGELAKLNGRLGENYLAAMAMASRRLGELDTERSRLLQELSASKQQLSEQSQRIGELNSELAERQRLVVVHEQYISALQNSLSWKITLPLRKVHELFVAKNVSSRDKNKSLYGYYKYALFQWGAYREQRGRYPTLAEIPKLVVSSLRNYKLACIGHRSFTNAKDKHVVRSLQDSSKVGTLGTEGPPIVASRAKVSEGVGQSETRKFPLQVGMYEAWVHVSQWNHRREERLRARLRELDDPPLLSVIMPVYDPPVEFLNRAIASVCSQVHGNWELCIADDASTNGEVRTALIKWAETDVRIRVCYRETNGNISVATNTAASLATGGYFVFLDQDDVLTPDALGEIALYITANPETDILYSDDDKIDTDGKRFAPQFKPDWSPELLLSYMYFSHVFVISKNLFEEIGGLRAGFDGSQDYDLALRASERARCIGHIPMVLYHWRALPDSTASSAKAKPSSIEAGRKAVQDALDRRGISAVAYQADWAKEAGVGIYSHRFTHEDPPRVTIVIPTKDQVEMLKRCVNSIIEMTDYPNYEILIIDNESVEEKTAKYLSKASKWPNVCTVKISNPDGRFNFAYINNRAAESVRSEYVLFLNSDTEVLKKEWLSQMLGYARIPGVGAVGARLLYPNKKIQHAGVIIKFYRGMAGHAFKGLDEQESGYLGYSKVLRNYTAVTAACMLTPRRLFLEMGGFDESSFGVAYNDVDYCCRLLDKGCRVVYTPDAELLHHEGHTRGYGDDPTENVNFRKKYYGKRDRFYNPNLSLKNEYFQVAQRVAFTGDAFRTIKTLMCTHNLNREGAPHSQYEMTVGLKEKGILDPVVFSPADGPLRELYESHGIRVVVDANLGNVFEIASYRERVDAFASFIGTVGAEMVYANTILNFHAVAAAQKAGLPSVWNIRESEQWQHYIDWWGAELAQEAATCFTYPYKVVFVAHATKSLYSAFETRHNFRVIHNGLDLKRIFKEAEKFSREAARAQLGVAHDELAILLPGTICERKGQHDLARAVGLIKSDCLQKIRCFIVGDWLTPHPYSEQLHSIVERLSKEAGARLTIVPVTGEIFKYYKAADIFVCTSRIESFPRIILEAMAFGLPIITTPVFGIQEQVQSGVNAIFYSPGDVKALAIAVEQLVTDANMRMNYARNSSHVLQQIGTFEDMVDCYAAVFRAGYLSGRGRPHMHEAVLKFKAARAHAEPLFKRVTFLTTYADEHSQRYRVHNIIEGLTDAGIECALIKEDFLGRLEGVLNCDLLVVFRVGLSDNVRRIIERFKERYVPTIFDIDDLVFEPDSSELLHGLTALSERDRLKSLHNIKRLRATLLACDYATCTTTALSKRIRALGKRCFIIPNTISKKQFDLAQTLKSERSPRRDDKIRIGYFSGTNTHDKDFLEVSDALFEVMERNDNAELHIVGILNLNAKFEKFGERVVRRPLMDHISMLRCLAGMDINLAPLEMNNTFTAAKSELKIFEAALVGVLTVASPTESYAGCITDGVNGFFAATKEEWVEKLEKLVADADLRQRLAEKAEIDFVQRYHIKNVIKGVIDTYERITQGHKTVREGSRYVGK